MTMTRQHFTLIAEVLEVTKPTGAHPERMAQWLVTVKEFLEMLDQTNERFDRTRFLKACGLSEKEEVA